MLAGCAVGHVLRCVCNSIGNDSYLDCELAVTLSELPLHRAATVKSVQDLHANDAIARRLRELGFVPGEEVVPLARGPIGGEPVLIQVGYTRFALRLAEAARVQVEAHA